jgi:hypothetical protein
VSRPTWAEAFIAEVRREDMDQEDPTITFEEFAHRSILTDPRLTEPQVLKIIEAIEPLELTLDQVTRISDAAVERLKRS